MPVQTSYNRLQDPRFHGSLNDLNEAEVQSGAAEVAIAVGVAVARGTASGQVKLAANANFLGIAIRDISREGVINTGSLDYAVNENVSVLRSGRIHLTCAEGCTAGAVVKYNDTTGVIGSGSAGAGETAIGGATWETTVAAGAVGIVRLPSTVTIA